MSASTLQMSKESFFQEIPNSTFPPNPPCLPMTMAHGFIGS